MNMQLKEQKKVSCASENIFKIVSTKCNWSSKVVPDFELFKNIPQSIFFLTSSFHFSFLKIYLLLYLIYYLNNLLFIIQYYLSEVKAERKCEKVMMFLKEKT